jgi:hypothetical protein
MISIGTILRMIAVTFALLVCLLVWAVFDNYSTSNRLNRNAELIENAAALSKHNTELLEEIIEMKKQEATERVERHGAKP